MEGRRKGASLPFRWGVVISLIVVLGICLFIWSRLGLEMVISNQETGEVYLKRQVSVDDMMTYKWIHSFEHIPWYEDFRIKGVANMDLEETRVAGFGAGIPENQGAVTVSNGMVVSTDIHKRFDHIQWINSQTALQYIAINDEVVIKGSEMPHHEPLQLKIERRFYLWRKPH